MTGAAYWGERAESRSRCAERTLQFIKSISICSPLLSTWYYGGSSPNTDEWQKVDITLDCLTKILALSARRDRSRLNLQEEHPFIGSHFGLWNGRTSDEEASGLSISCGLASRYLTNAVVLDIPRVLTAADHGESVLDDQPVGLFRSVVSAFAKAWDPDWAAIFDVKNKNGVGPFLDRMLYVSERERTRQSFLEPTSARSEAFGDGLMYVPH